MPHRLKRLRITRADLVDRGANYDPTSGEGAHVVLFKRDPGLQDHPPEAPEPETPDEPPAEPSPDDEDEADESDQEHQDAAALAKRIARRGKKYVVLSESGRVLGTHDTRAEAVQQWRAVEASTRRRGAKKAVMEALGKIFGWEEEEGVVKEEPAPPTFTEALMREKMDEVMEDLSDHVWALRSTLYGVLASAATNKAALVSSALDQFKSHAGGCVTRWLSGDEATAKAGRKISADRLTRLKAMSAELSRLIAEAEAAPQGLREGADATLAKQGRLSGAKPIWEEDADMPTQEEFDALKKRMEEFDGLKTQLDETNVKLATAEAKVAKAEETAQTEKELREAQENIGIAKRLGLNPDDDVPLIKTLRAACPEGWAWIEKKFTALQAQVKAGGLFKHAGRDGSREPAGYASDEAFQRAEALIEKDAKLGVDDALAKVFRDDPELYRRYHRESSVHGTDKDEE
jgi:hypothetical protein